MIAITAFITSFVNYIFFPSVALCGASGVVFAFILLSSFTSFKEGEIPITFILVAVFFMVSRYGKELQYRTTFQTWHISLVELSAVSWAMD